MLTATTSNKEMQQAAPAHEREETLRQLAQSLAWPFPDFQPPLLLPLVVEPLWPTHVTPPECLPRLPPPPPVPALRSAPEAGAGPLLFSDIPPGYAVLRRSVTPEQVWTLGRLAFRGQNPDSDEDEDAPGDAEEESVVGRRGDTRPPRYSPRYDALAYWA